MFLFFSNIELCIREPAITIREHSIVLYIYWAHYSHRALYLFTYLAVICRNYQRIQL